MLHAQIDEIVFVVCLDGTVSVSMAMMKTEMLWVKKCGKAVANPGLCYK